MANSWKKRICAGAAACMMMAASFPVQVLADTRPEYLKAATYVSDAWVINFWNTESDHMDEELAQIADDGFNGIILVIPWREFQPSTNPVSYSSYAFEKLDRVMRMARSHGLWVEMRLSYTWDYAGDADAKGRFREMLGNGRLRRGWLDYMEKMYETVAVYPNFYGGFITWEDFWNYVEDAPAVGTGQAGVEEAERIGFQDYLREYYTLDQVNDYYKPVRPFENFNKVYIPQRSSPAYKLFYEFYDDFLVELLGEAQQVFPNLSMEVRLDVDPVSGRNGGQVGAHHFRTFPCGSSGYTSLMYSVSMGQEANQQLTADSAISTMGQELATVHAYNGGKPVFIDQLLYMDETEGFAHNARLRPEERGEYLTGIPSLLRIYTNGYGIWSYRNYANNPLFNCQFALKLQGWDSSRAQVRERGGSNQVFLAQSGSISQKVGARIAGKAAHDNHVRFTADSDRPVDVTVMLGQQARQVHVDGPGQFDLNFGKCAYDEVLLRAGGEVYLDNIQVYNFIQDGQLYDIDNNELSCLSSMRALNRAMD